MHFQHESTYRHYFIYSGGLPGGRFPDQLRIEVTKQRLNADTLMAFEDFSSTKICSGEYDLRVETEWNQFSSTLIRIGASLLRKGSNYPAAASAANPAAPAPAAPAPAVPAALPSSSNPPAGSCWRYTHAGTCTLDEVDCKFSHPGALGAFKTTVCTADGHCKMEQKRGHCSRDNCPFLHSEDDAKPEMLPILPAGRLPIQCSMIVPRNGFEF